MTNAKMQLSNQCQKEVLNNLMCHPVHVYHLVETAVVVASRRSFVKLTILGQIYHGFTGDL